MANGPFNRIPSNGGEVFGDNLVGNQFTDGSSQFTLGNFSIRNNVTDKISRDFSFGNFSQPITLESMNITDTQQMLEFSSNRLDVFINYDRSVVSNYTLYGSLRERFKVSVQNVIKKFPGGIRFNSIRTWSDYVSGNTATSIIYYPSENNTFLNLNLSNSRNPFDIEFTSNSTIYNDPNVEPLRNLANTYEKYSLFVGGKSYPLVFLRPTTGNTTTGNLYIGVRGNPFSGQSSSTLELLVRPNNNEVELAFDSLDDVDRILVERKTVPLYTATFQVPQETDNGRLVQTQKYVTWPTDGLWNILITGRSFDRYVNNLYEISDEFDSYKTNLISRLLTTASFKEFDTVDNKVEKVLQIYGRSFDEIKKYIDGLAYMTNVTYDSINNIPNKLLKNLAHTLGWKTPSAIENEDLLDSLFNTSDNNTFPNEGIGKTPFELDSELYRRLILNTAYLFKSKGTRKAIEFMLRFVGAPDALIEFNENVYLAGQKISSENLDRYQLKISGGTYFEDVPVKNVYQTVINTIPPTIVTGFTYGYETVLKQTTVPFETLPVDNEGYPTIPKYGPNAYFQAGSGWFEQTPEHRGKIIINQENSNFNGVNPTVSTELNRFTYGEPYLDLYRRFPDSKEGFDIVRTVDNRKSWVRNTSTRYYNLDGRGTNYNVSNDKLVINVKNVDIFLNVGQGLEYDVWSQSKKFNCPFVAEGLTSPYPSIGGPDWTEVKVDATKLSFFEFAEKAWRVLINVKNRQTIDDGKGGGYPTLQKIYLDYLNSQNTCGVPSNQYTYEKMIKYVEGISDYWIRLVEQFIPGTTIWQAGKKYENSIFHRQKFVYKHQDTIEETFIPIGESFTCEPIPTEPIEVKEGTYDINSIDCLDSSYAPCLDISLATGSTYTFPSNFQFEICDPDVVIIDGCSCTNNGGGRLTTPVNLFPIQTQDIPQEVLNFYLTPEVVDRSFQWSNLLGTQSIGKDIRRGTINLCCIGDTFEVEIIYYPDNPSADEREYRQLQPITITFPLEVTETFLLEVYQVPILINGLPFERRFLHIPNVQTFLINNTYLINNGSGGNLPQIILNYLDTIQSFTFQIGETTNGFGFEDNALGLITDFGDQRSGNPQDRYFGDTYQDGGGQFDGSLTIQELGNIANTSDTNLLLAIVNSYGNRGTYNRFNVGLRIGCETSTFNTFEFSFNLAVGTPTIQEPCALQGRNAPLIDQNGEILPKTLNIENVVTDGGSVEVPIKETIMNINDNIDLRNYEIDSTDLYIVQNLNSYQINGDIPYNSPIIKRDTNGLSVYKFISDNKSITELKWISQLTNNNTSSNLTIKFLEKSNQRLFEEDLKTKDIALGSEQYRLTTDSDETPAKYATINDWAVRSIGETNQFTNKSINYDVYGVFDSFEVTPSFVSNTITSDYSEGVTPLGDLSQEIILTSKGRFSSFKSINSGSTLTGLTDVYSGYTNISGYTDYRGENFSPDDVFDLYLEGSQYTVNTSIPLSDRTFGNYRFLGSDRLFIPSIPLQTLQESNGPIVFLPRDKDDYLYYEIPQTKKYRIQFKTFVDFSYVDEGFCNYLDTYRNLSNNNYPTNDFDFKNLINSSILYQGGSITTPQEYREGNVSNSVMSSYSALTPAFGYNPGTGISDFMLKVYVERTLSGTTSATTIGEYVIGVNPTNYPNANEHLLLEVNDSDKYSNLYECSGTSATTKVFVKKFTPYIDTGCITLNKGDEIRLKTTINWQSTSKSTTGTTGTTISLNVGSNVDTDNLIEERPWYRIINKECNLPNVDLNLIWQPDLIQSTNDFGVYDNQPTPVVEGQNQGKLSVVTTLNGGVNNRPPIIKKSNLNDLKYFDLPGIENYSGKLKFIGYDNPTNNWVTQIENGSIIDYKLQSDKILDYDKSSKEPKLYFNIPIKKTNDTLENFNDNRFTFLIRTRLKAKGTQKLFDIFNSFIPEFKNDNVNQTIVTPSESISAFGSNIGYVKSRPMEQRTFDWRDGLLYLKDEVAVIESSVYKETTPSPNELKREYCQCSDGSYVEVDKNSTKPCIEWCCALQYTTTTYYPCKEQGSRYYSNKLRNTRLKTRPTSSGDIRGIIRDI